ncbi:MAG: insulinase family protein [Candidatus Pacebacteria bacterium]|nr:insulinase family protein [Candidatus Paceibacterota bacterium]
MHYSKKTLDNGLRVITVPNTESLAATILVLTETGSKYETRATNGLAHFLEHMIFKGTPTRPKSIDISHELESIGAQYNAFTSQEYTGYYAKVSARHFEKALDIISDMYSHPLLEESEIQKEKGVITEEIRMYQDMPHRHVQDMIMELLYGDTPAGWNIAGKVETVRNFTQQDFINYRKEHYTTGTTIVVVSGNYGDIDIESRFKDIPVGQKSNKVPVIEQQSEPQVLIENKDTDQTHLVIGIRGLSVQNPRTPVARILAHILGGGMSSRLFERLRTKMGVGYYVHASHDAYTDHGVFSISTGVDKARVDEVVIAILEECRLLIDAKVSDVELDRTKNNIIGSLELGLETSDAQGEFFGFQEVLKGNIETAEEVNAKIMKVTSEQIQEMAKELFVNKNLNIALVGSYPDKEKLKSLLKI